MSAPEKPMTAEQVVALARKYGVAGIRTSEHTHSVPENFGPQSTGRSARPFQSEGSEKPMTAEQVVSLARKYGVAGIRPASAEPAAATSPSGYRTPVITPQVIQPVQPATFPSKASTRPSAPKPLVHSSDAKLSRVEFAVLSINAGNEGALAALEAKMGMPFASEAGGKALWSASPMAGGESRRAFMINFQDKLALTPLTGQLTSGLRLSIERIDASKFSRTGPGANPKTGPQFPPDLPSRLPGALRSALGK